MFLGSHTMLSTPTKVPQLSYNSMIAMDDYNRDDENIGGNGINFLCYYFTINIYYLCLCLKYREFFITESSLSESSPSDRYTFRSKSRDSLVDLSHSSLTSSSRNNVLKRYRSKSVDSPLKEVFVGQSVSTNKEPLNRNLVTQFDDESPSKNLPVPNFDSLVSRLDTIIDEKISKTNIYLFLCIRICICIFLQSFISRNLYKANHSVF